MTFSLANKYNLDILLSAIAHQSNILELSQMDRDMCAMFPNGIWTWIIDNDNKLLKSAKKVLPILNFEGMYILAITVLRAR